MQKRANRIISKSTFDSHSDPIFKELELLKLSDIRQLELGKLVFSLNHSLLPSLLTVVVFVQCFYTDVAKTSISNFLRVGTFSGELPQARTVLLFGSYYGQIFPRRNLLTRRRVISLAVRDRQCNELPAKFKITWPL